jgi:EAL domain-containing protein (putative c-di-GMP-specific phosphodiesterase class I)
MEEGTLENQRPEEAIKSVAFGRRKVMPRVCIADDKRHIRKFVGEALEELGFITCECTQVGELSTVLDAQLPDLVVVGLSTGGIEAAAMLKALAARAFDGNVLLLGPRNSSVVAVLEELGEQLGIAMLPTLATPFGTEGLHNSVATFLPIEAPPSPAVDVAEALRFDWLELWYQPKIHTRALVMRGAEALIRMRHPTWGIVAPANFIPHDSDPHFRALSEFVIRRAVEDWRYFVDQHGPVEVAINLPISFLKDPKSVKSLSEQLPDHPAFEGLIIEINGTEIIANLELVKDVAKRLRFYNIAISIDDLGMDWSRLVGLHDFPFVEIKVDRTLVAGCADDRLKQTACRWIVDFANGYGVRTVAEGVGTRADFLTVRELGFDLVQGFLFAKPMTAQKFARTMLRHPMMVPQ